MKLKRNIQIATRMDLYFDSVFFSIFELRQSFSLIADHGECPFRCTTRSTNQNCVLIPLACQFYNIFRCFYYSIYNLQLNFIQIFKFYQRYKEKCWKLRMILIFFCIFKHIRFDCHEIYRYEKHSVNRISNVWWGGYSISPRGRIMSVTCVYHQENHSRRDVPRTKSVICMNSHKFQLLNRPFVDRSRSILPTMNKSLFFFRFFSPFRI